MMDCCLRQEWETLWGDPELPEGRYNTTAGDQEGADGTSGRDRVYVCDDVQVCERHSEYPWSV